MTSKLALYNDALLALSQERLVALSDASTARYALDEAYDGALAYCLEQGLWTFAMRSVMLNHAASIAPAFGFTYGFTKPADLVRLYRLSAQETMADPLLEYVDEAGYWFANTDPLYVRFVSSLSTYGGDLSRWSQTYADFVSLRLALKTAKRITGSEPSDKLERDYKKAMGTARSNDAMNEPPGFAPAGSWVRSRGSGVTRSRWDGTTR